MRTVVETYRFGIDCVDIGAKDKRLVAGCPLLFVFEDHQSYLRYEQKSMNICIPPLRCGGRVKLTLFWKKPALKAG